MLLGPLAIGGVYIYYHILQTHSPAYSPAEITQRLADLYTLMDFIAPWMLTAAVAVYWAKAIFTRNLSYVVIGVLVGCLLLRELHWDPAIKKAIFPLLGICMFWMLCWRDIIDKPAANRWHTIFFVAALATYGFGQMVEKRLFRFLPDENTLHSQFEECIEVAAHLLIFLAAVLGDFRRRKLTVSPAP